MGVRTIKACLAAAKADLQSIKPRAEKDKRRVDDWWAIAYNQRTRQLAEKRVQHYEQELKNAEI